MEYDTAEHARRAFENFATAYNVNIDGMMNKKIEELTKQLEATQAQLKVLRKAEEPLVNL